MNLRGTGRDGRRGVVPCAVLGMAALSLAFASLATVSPSRTDAQDWAPPETVFVESTGHTVDGLFLDVWHSDTELLGDPITEEFEQRGLDITGRGTPVPDEVAEYVVQYFEN